jgi:hypothetical protein
MKDFIKVVCILAFFAFFGVATSKSLIPFPCDRQISNYLEKDSLSLAFYQGFSKDTVVIRTYKDTLWDIKSAGICKILRDSCHLNGRKVLVIDTTYNPALFDTRFGKTIHFTYCP